MKTVLRGAGLALLLAGGAAPPAMAQGMGQGATGGACGDLVDRFAAAQNLSAAPPPTVTPPGATGLPPGTAGSTGESDGGVTSRDLARSGGVITPPAVGDPAVIDPPLPRNETMPTAPAIRPDAGSTADAPPPTGGAMGLAAVRAQMEALVTAARAAARSGDESQCMDSLNKARRLSETGAGAGTRPEGGG
ncbi:MAG TPA: hypothetical protein VD995_33600 [Azospirillum sp.]|nr:hypothetical protein [Azospirillum sp.]